MERDNPFGNYEPTISRVGKAIDWLASHLSVFPDGVELCLAEHQPHGAAEMLDSELYDVPDNVELGQE